MIPPYETALREAEKSAATMEKYLHHVRQFVAHDAGRRIQEQAMEQNEPGNREFVDLNYPLALDPEQEPLWSFYTNEGIRELFVNTFYPVFHGELGILKENA